MENMNKENEEQKVGMRYYKAILYFIAWVSIALNLTAIILTILGTFYEGGADLVYDEYPILRVLDILYIITIFVVICVEIGAWFGLKNFKAYAPGLFMSVLLINALLPFIYSTVLLFVADVADMFTVLARTPLALVYYFVSRNYFNNEERAMLFRN